MTNQRIRIGLIGTGRIGQVHAASIADSKTFELTYTADVFVAGAEKIANEYGGKFTNDPEVLLNSGEVDAILIASPTPTHVDLIRRGIQLGLHVLCEKPIDLDIARVDELRAEAAAAKTVIALGFNRRFDPNFASVQARVAAGELGKLEQLIIISRDPAPAPQEYIAVSGGIFRDMTIHDFDMARFFIPNIVEVSATGTNSFCDYIKAENDFDNVTVTLRGSQDEIVTIVNSRHASFGYDQRIEAFGEKGMLVASNVQANTVKSYTADSVEVSEPYPNFFLERYADAYRRELHDFGLSITTGNVTNPTYEDGRAALVLANAALESATTGRAVKVSL
jgi:myo-inositol 2-dehydrogenase/D-chiro-inositol 1-dehydrogenase